jgi:hypothetical protein
MEANTSDSNVVLVGANLKDQFSIFPGCILFLKLSTVKSKLVSSAFKNTSV